MANLQDLKTTHVNVATLHIQDAATQQKNAARKKLVKQQQADEISITLVNNDTQDRVFSLFNAQDLDYTNTRFRTNTAIVKGQVMANGAVLCDIQVDLPAGIASLQAKLKRELAVIAAIGFQVSADGNVDQYQKNFFFSQIVGLEQTDTLVKDIKTRVDGNVEQRTQLIWPKVFQATEGHDFIATVKAQTILVLILKISEYGKTFAAPSN